MARRHRRRGLGAFSLSALKNTSSKPLDIVLGAAAGIAGIYAVKFIINKIPNAPAFLQRLSPLLGGAVAGGLLYVLQSKKNVNRAVGTAIGAATVGVMLQAKNEIDKMPFAVSNGLADYGVMLDEGALNAYVEEQPSLEDYSGANLAMLAELNEMDDDEDFEELLDA